VATAGGTGDLASLTRGIAAADVPGAGAPGADAPGTGPAPALRAHPSPPIAVRTMTSQLAQLAQLDEGVDGMLDRRFTTFV
jgi:hypothetical protein